MECLRSDRGIRITQLVHDQFQETLLLFRSLRQEPFKHRHSFGADRSDRIMRDLLDRQTDSVIHTSLHTETLLAYLKQIDEVRVELLDGLL